MSELGKRQARTFVNILLVIILAGLAGCNASLANPTQKQMATQVLQVVNSATPLPPNPSATTAVTITATSIPSTPTPIPSPAPSDTAAPTQNPASFTWTLVANGLNDPIGIANAADGSGRLFVLEKAGAVRIVKNGQLQPTPFLDIRSQVRSSGSEQGLLGLVFDPDYQNNGYFYVDYTDLRGNTVIARFSAAGNPDQADASSEKTILTFAQPFSNHNGGQLAFGPDGYLYIGAGDGGSEGDPRNNGQSLTTFLGKILRIDVHQSSPYTIPASNPFASGGGMAEIWAYGLRNPWRFSFDQASGDLFIGDVGQDNWEEVDVVSSGYQGPALNFGWSCREGLHAYKGCSPTPGVTFTDPVWEYDHSQGCAIIGGIVYRGKDLPALDGVYLTGDYCSGNVWGVSNLSGQGWNGQLLYQTGLAITSFGVDESGEVFLTDQHGGLYQLVP